MSSDYSMKIKNILKKHSTKRNILSLLVLIIIFNIALGKVLGGIEPEIFDTKLYYTASEVKYIISNYSDEEKSTYIKGILSLDYIYPLVYSLFFSLLIFKFSKSVKPSLIPFIIVFFDYLENSSILIMLTFHPQEFPYIAVAAGFFTLFKWLFLLITLILAIFFIIKNHKNV